MTDIPEDFFDVMREAIDIAWSARSLDHKKLSVRIYRALLSERSRQIERDAKIVEGPPMNKHAPGYLLIQKLAAAIRAQQEPQ